MVDTLLPVMVDIVRQTRELTGQHFGRLVVLGKNLEQSATNKRPYWDCRCECGGFKTVPTGSLTQGLTTSCGCVKREMLIKRNTKHGLCNIPEYGVWNFMKVRCNDSNRPDYYLYGGRGIKVDSRWDDFEMFYHDVGPRPGPGYSIERLNNNGNYEPGNVVWATARQQANNRRTSRIITFNGKSQTIAQWGRDLGISPKRIANRINELQWTVEKALTSKVGSVKPGPKQQL